MIHSDYVYSRDYRGKIKMVVLVFIFSFFFLSFFSVANANITRKDLEKRGVFVKCIELSKSYSDSVAKQAKFVGLELKKKAHCNVSKNEMAKAKENLKAAIESFPDDAEAVYLLLQIKLEESIKEEKPKVDLTLFEELTDKVKGDWPQRDFETDSYYYIQEARTLLTPYLIFVIYDFIAAVNSAPEGYDMDEARTNIGKMISFVGGTDGCVSLLSKVDNKMKQHRAENESRRAKPINPKAYDVYSDRLKTVKEEVCPDLQNLLKN